ncbi:MAG TPA: hypothetical protein ENG89_01360 [Candidatus Moranbacteria bacterium]|nr:hypothetical protein [Candidatus Moranbacteria bacterium]
MADQETSPQEEQIGEVTHFFGKAGVAVIKLSSDLAVGDTVKIVRGDHESEEKIESMQVDHQPVESGKSEDEVAIKIGNPTKEGAAVYKAS